MKNKQTINKCKKCKSLEFRMHDARKYLIAFMNRKIKFMKSINSHKKDSYEKATALRDYEIIIQELEKRLNNE